MGFLQEAVRWWDHWLKGIDTGIMDEPMYRVWMQESVVPDVTHAVRPGRWVAETSWPSSRIGSRRLTLDAAGLLPTAGTGAPRRCRSLETTGLRAGDWCAFGIEGEMPDDQRSDDRASLAFDSAPLATPLEILGAPVVEMEVAVDRPRALLVARLCDVRPDGASLRVTYGVLNLTHRNGHARPEPLDAGRRYRIRLALKHIAHSFPAGHALRLALSTSYWPVVWPAPDPVTLTVFPGAGWLELPVRPPSADDARLRPLGPPERLGPSEGPDSERPSRRVERDPASDEIVYTIASDAAELDAAGTTRIEAIDLDIATSMLRRYRIAERDPATARAEVEQKTLFRRGAWTVRVETRTEMSATPSHFVLRGDLRAYEGEECVFARRWHEPVPRSHL
jgi:hypothetical protein